MEPSRSRDRKLLYLRDRHFRLYFYILFIRQPRKKKTAPAEPAEKNEEVEKKNAFYDEVTTQRNAFPQAISAEGVSIMERKESLCFNGIYAPHQIPQDKDGYCPVGFNMAPPPGTDCLGKDLLF